MKYVRMVLLMIIILSIIIFTFQNFGTVTIVFLKWEITLPLAFTAISIYVLGMFTGGLLWSGMKRLTRDSRR
ncbi:MAG: hypothetical protein ACSLE0_09180 [Chitinophagaceae bacterium]